MRIKIPYGSRPGEKVISEGFFACPFCRYKRPYVKKKVVKVNYFGLISVASSKALMEYIHCGGCLKVFPVETIETENQLKVQLLDYPLPSSSLLDQWQFAYQKLQCEEILGKNPEFNSLRFPILTTSADQMQKAGASIKLKMFDDTKVHMYNILSLSNQYFEGKAKYKFDPSPADENVKEFSEMAHYILSKLPN